MKKCKRCGTHDVVLKADKSQPSRFCDIAPQSDSEETHWAAIKRWIFAYLTVETDYCYYCTKVLNNRITKPIDYSVAYEAKQTPTWEIR